MRGEFSLRLYCCKWVLIFHRLVWECKTKCVNVGYFIIVMECRLLFLFLDSNLDTTIVTVTFSLPGFNSLVTVCATTVVGAHPTREWVSVAAVSQSPAIFTCEWPPQVTMLAIGGAAGGAVRILSGLYILSLTFLLSFKQMLLWLPPAEPLSLEECTKQGEVNQLI